MRIVSAVVGVIVVLAAVAGVAQDREKACETRHGAKVEIDPEVDAFVDQILDADPMHRWIRQQTDDLKKQIRSGEMQHIYAKFFVEE